MSPDWPALAAARRQDVPRLPFSIGGSPAGSVARANLSALQEWPQWLLSDGQQLRLAADDASQALGCINASLRGAGLIRAWRDETYGVVTHLGAPPLALIERAAARFWGTLTFGAHATGYVGDASGRPTHLWIARRSADKATDPGKLDNLIGGGVPWGQTPLQTLLREGFEEAGLGPALLATARPGHVLELACDIAEGFMHEQLHTFDVRLPAGLAPVNQDGEVAEWHCLPLDEALALAAGDAMTTDAALVTLDFALRHGLVPPAEQARLAASLAVLIRAPSAKLV